MKIARQTQAAVLVVSILAVFGCTTTQPDRDTAREASVSVKSQASVQIFDCYEVWKDTDGSGDIDPLIDENQGQKCTAVGGVKPRKCPWRYSMSISLIRAGTVLEETVTSLSGLSGSSVEPGEDPENHYISMANYDNAKPAAIPENYSVDGVTFYLFGKTVSQGSPIYLAGQVPSFPLIEPNILGSTDVKPGTAEPPIFTFKVSSGDTVIVRVRKQPYSLAPHFLPFGTASQIKISPELAIGGVPVATTPPPPLVSSVENGAGLTFSFTVQ